MIVAPTLTLIQLTNGRNDLAAFTPEIHDSERLSTILYKPIADILPARSHAAAAARLLQTRTRNLLSSAIPWPSAPDTTTPIASKSKARTCVLGRR